MYFTLSVINGLLLFCYNKQVTVIVRF